MKVGKPVCSQNCILWRSRKVTKESSKVDFFFSKYCFTGNRKRLQRHMAYFLCVCPSAVFLCTCNDPFPLIKMLCNAYQSFKQYLNIPGHDTHVVSYQLLSQYFCDNLGFWYLLSFRQTLWVQTAANVAQEHSISKLLVPQDVRNVFALGCPRSVQVLSDQRRQ